jgi:putative SOS response-associated peptidase YedK
MCARYASPDEARVLSQTYSLNLPVSISLKASLIYPHTGAPVIIQVEAGRELRLMNYGLVPEWSKVRKPKFATYNARLEGILEKPTWRKAFQTKHCLVPIQYFVESVYEGPYAGHNINIEAPDSKILTAAGIWESWVDKKTGEVLDSFAILTSPPPEAISQVGHDRCPLFLQEDIFDIWIHEKKEGREWLRFLESLRLPQDWKFTQQEEIKSFNRQLSLIDD